MADQNLIRHINAIYEFTQLMNLMLSELTQLKFGESQPIRINDKFLVESLIAMDNDKVNILEKSLQELFEVYGYSISIEFDENNNWYPYLIIGKFSDDDPGPDGDPDGDDIEPGVELEYEKKPLVMAMSAGAGGR